MIEAAVRIKVRIQQTNVLKLYPVDTAALEVRGNAFTPFVVSIILPGDCRV